MLYFFSLQGYEASFSKYPSRILKTYGEEVKQSKETNSKNLYVPTPSDFPTSSVTPSVTLNSTVKHLASAACLGF